MHTSTDHLFARPFSIQQAARSGLSRAAVSKLVRDRTLRRVLRGVYAHRCLPDTLETRLDALSLLVHDQVVVHRRTAAWLFGVDSFRYAELDAFPPIETCVPQDLNRLRRAGVAGARVGLLPTEVMELNGLLVTTPIRTAIDLGRTLSRREALAALDRFLNLGLFNQTALRNELRKFAGYRGIIQLRELAELADGRSESSGESWTRLVIIDAGLPPAQPQYSVAQYGREIYRLDLAYPRLKVCIEYDGVQFHDSDADRTRDTARRDWLRRHGWYVIVVRKEDLTQAAIERWTGELRRVLAERVR
ncbi:MAG: DUF559 domain-containing protein [Nocardioidaceae bacterium]